MKPLRVTKLRPDREPEGLASTLDEMIEFFNRAPVVWVATRESQPIVFSKFSLTGRWSHIESNVVEVKRRPDLIEWALTDPSISEVFAATGFKRTGVKDGYRVDKENNCLYVLVDDVEYLAFPRP